MCGITYLPVSAGVNFRVGIAIGIAVKARPSLLSGDWDTLLKHTRFVRLKLHTSVEIKEDRATSSYLLQHVSFRHLTVGTTTNVVGVLDTDYGFAVSPLLAAVGLVGLFIGCARLFNGSKVFDEEGVEEAPATMAAFVDEVAVKAVLHG